MPDLVRLHLHSQVPPTHLLLESEVGNLTSTCTLPLNIKPQHLVLPVVLAIEDLLLRHDISSLRIYM